MFIQVAVLLFFIHFLVLCIIDFLVLCIIGSHSSFLFTEYKQLCFGIIQGKTLAFVLPILESLTNGPTKIARKTGYGRVPSVLVLLPTRELATQVVHKKP